MGTSGSKLEDAKEDFYFKYMMRHSTKSMWQSPQKKYFSGRKHMRKKTSASILDVIAEVANNDWLTPITLKKENSLESINQILELTESAIEKFVTSSQVSAESYLLMIYTEAVCRINFFLLLILSETVECLRVVPSEKAFVDLDIQNRGGNVSKQHTVDEYVILDPEEALENTKRTKLVEEIRTLKRKSGNNRIVDTLESIVIVLDDLPAAFLLPTFKIPQSMEALIFPDETFDADDDVIDLDALYTRYEKILSPIKQKTVSKLDVQVLLYVLQTLREAYKGLTLKKPITNEAAFNEKYQQFCKIHFDKSMVPLIYPCTLKFMEVQKLIQSTTAPQEPQKIEGDLTQDYKNRPYVELRYYEEMTTLSLYYRSSPHVLRSAATASQKRATPSAESMAICRESVNWKLGDDAILTWIELLAKASTLLPNKDGTNIPKTIQNEHANALQQINVTLKHLLSISGKL